MPESQRTWREEVGNGLGAIAFGLLMGSTYYFGYDIGILSPSSRPMALAFGIAMIASPVAVVIGIGLVIRGALNASSRR
jgi:hypothetical protein